MWVMLWIFLAVVASVFWLIVFADPEKYDDAIGEHSLWLFILHLICFVLSGALVSCANDYAGWNACGTVALFVLVGKYGHSVYRKRRKVNVVD